jgi:hypothetical protein
MGAEQSFGILGRSLICTGLPPALLDCLRERWAFPEHDLLQESRGGQAAPVYQIEVSAGSLLRNDWTGAQPRPVNGMTAPFEVAVNGDGFLYSGQHGRVECLHERGVTRIQIDVAGPPRGEHGRPPAEAELPAELEDALNLAVAEALRCSGLLPLHVAAALHGPQHAEQTTLFAGPSGRGKSTTLLQALRAGAVPVAEDLVWYDPGSNLVYGWERAVRLLPASLALLPQGVACGDWPISPDGKVNVPYSALRAAGGQVQDVRRGGAPLTRFLVLTRSPGQPSWLEPLGRRDAALALWEATGLPLGDQARAQLSAQMDALLAHTAFFRLHLGDDSLTGTLPLGIEADHARTTSEVLL